MVMSIHVDADSSLHRGRFLPMSALINIDADPNLSMLTLANLDVYRCRLVSMLVLANTDSCRGRQFHCRNSVTGVSGARYILFLPIPLGPIVISVTHDSW